MAGPLGATLDRLRHGWMLRRWGRIADAAEAMDLATLRRARGRARMLRRQLDRVIHLAEYRLALPVIGSNALRRPMGADWVWRPDLWRGPMAVAGQAPASGRTVLAEGATLFHDCRAGELTLRQIRNRRETDLAPFGLRLEVFRFDGSFLSLVLDLPAEAVEGLRLKHLIRLELALEREQPLQVFARLNIRHGPNVEQLVRELPPEEEVMVEFDLAYTKMNEKRVERLWLDLIFERPEMNQVILRDVTLSRRPRAEL
ncbi:hypothetical protein C5F48_17595 [Cereibacter changlensis JA139]|uniref:Uncharacterized protein n=2 Tax=Cereibacter changlensis TaxID=402884 RepID=A0A2T4JR88_9RHOB|nr:DUF6478 family protein [Cereibacter changlensis]PTE20424.1 hypothetical protein C5F48_17595 [Cereibacter changlensis JA139]PZX58740.1 hypothetical protein LX76_00243 [Cereibacter changlensis]